jgi:hypothetical protein
VKLQESALIEVPSSKLGLLTTDVGAGVDVDLTVVEVAILVDDTERMADADVADTLGVEATTTVEEAAGDEDGEGDVITVVFNVEVTAVVTVTRVELVEEELRRTTLDEVGAEEDTTALEVGATKLEEGEAAAGDDAKLEAGEAAAGDDATRLVADVAGADEGIGVEDNAAAVDEDAGAALVLR